MHFPSVEGVEKGEEEEEEERDGEEGEEEEEEEVEVKSKERVDKKQYVAPSAMPASDVEDEEVHTYNVMSFSSPVNQA